MNLIHFSVAMLIFITLAILLFKGYNNFLSLYVETVMSLEAKANSLKAMQQIVGLGFPEKWDDSSLKQLGLSDYVYKIPILITESEGIDRGYTLLNVSLSFDENCMLIAVNDTVRVYEAEKEVEATLYNQTFCEGRHLKKATLVLNSSFSAWQSRLFFVYFSNNSKVLGSEYILPYSTENGFNITIYPTEKMIWLSVDKLYALKDLEYKKATDSLMQGSEFYLEVTE